MADTGFEAETGCSPIPPGGPALCGRITLPGGGRAQYHFELGTTSSYGQDLPAAPGAEVAISPDEPGVDVDVLPSGLSPDTTYHYRLLATANGETVPGSDSVFHTPAEPPQLPEAPITESCPGPASPTERRLCGTLNPNASASVGYYFALNLGSGCTGGKKMGGGDVEGKEVSVSIDVAGLLPDTQYTYCLVATNASGETSGQALTFKSDPLPPDPLPSGEPPAAIAQPLVTTPPLPLVQPAPEAKAQKVATALKRCRAKPRKQRSRCRTRVRQRLGSWPG